MLQCTETVSPHDFISFRCIPRSGVARSCCSSIFNYSRDHCTVFLMAEPIYFPPKRDSHSLITLSIITHESYGFSICKRDFPGGSVVKNLPAVQDMWVPSLGREDPLEKELATHSSILAWEIPWAEKPGRLQSIGSQKSQTQLGD